MNHIQITRLPTKYGVDEFLDHHENALVELFYKQKKELHPFGNLLLKDGSSLLILFTEDKDISIQETKLLASMSGAIAYIGISEAFVKTMNADNLDDESIKKIVKQLGPISSLPDREEVLLMVIEYRKNGKVTSDMIMWTIENTSLGRKLSNRRSGVNKIEGRMIGVIK